MQSVMLSVVAGAIGVKLPEGQDRIVEGVCTDTRQGAEGALFFALAGENADGHDFVARAFGAGAAAAVVERRVEGAAGPQIVVPDALKALGQLARWYRERFDIPVIGITGSVGKTSTREMVACALRAKLNVLTSEKNFNNEIGVPLTLLKLDSSHRAAVIEMGMRGAGQIAELCAIARPNVGLITNIGLSHIELLGSRERLARAKGELLEGLPTDGAAILPADDDFARALVRIARGRRVRTFGLKEGADFHATDITFDSDGTSRSRINGVQFTIHAAGVHHIVNACAACAVAAELGIPLEDAAAQLESYRAPAMRMESVALADGITLLNDAYNAAPDSMRAALETLRMVSNGRRTVAILGDMKELGDWSDVAHRVVGETAAREGVDLLVCVGAAAQIIAGSARGQLGDSRVVSYSDTHSAARNAANLLETGDVVLVKGSRAMAMEQIVYAIMEAKNERNRL